MVGQDERLTALLNVHSYYSFGAGTASPTSLVKRAAELGYSHIALTDDSNITGCVELFQAARKHGVTALIGATVPVVCGSGTHPFVLIAASPTGYATICRLLTLLHAPEERPAVGRSRPPQVLEKREERVVTFNELLAHSEGVVLLSGPREGVVSSLLAERRITELERLLDRLKEAFGEHFYLQLFHDRYRWDSRRASVIRHLAHHRAIPVVSAPEVRYAAAADYRLYDALTCARLGISVQQPHERRPQNACQYLPSAEEVTSRLPFKEGFIGARLIAERASFDLLPERICPPSARVPVGLSAHQHLEQRCFSRLASCYPDPALRADAEDQLREELGIIREFDLADFFLVAAEVTDHCEQSGILAAGRGSAASSVICYLLGVSKADPIANDLLFERFLHTGMKEMPDIDIDVSSARREDLLAWVEERFGATTEAMVCNKITYRLPLALQDLGRALGLPKELRDRLGKVLGRDFRGLRPHGARLATEVLEEVLGDSPALAALLDLLTRMERKHARHLAPHSGGVVMVRGELTDYSPLERSTGGIRLLQLDKDDAEAMGLIKLDLLGLRMLSALERAREEVLRLEGVWLDVFNLPEDERVWDLIEDGATLGLFQVESPSQMQTSRAMKPRSMADLAHQVALIRPGPIQSGTVHPYLRRRQGKEKVTYWHPSLEKLLAKTYGVLLFQDDILRIAVHFAGMSWTEASRFRKMVTDWGDSLADLEPFREDFIERGMRKVGASRSEAEAVFEAVKGYQGFGFSESHAWSFAQHAYASGWLRVNYPAEFMAAILNEEPGMWPQLTKRHEARSWGVSFLPFDINRSGAHYRCEHVSPTPISVPGGDPHFPVTLSDKAVRPPLSEVKGISKDAAADILTERLRHGHYLDVDDLYQRITIPLDCLEQLVRAGAFDEMQPRRDALYRVGVLATSQEPGAPVLFSGAPETPYLQPLPQPERFVWDFKTTRLSTLELHPADLVRDQLRELGCVPLWRARRSPRHTTFRTAGMIVARQKPPTANGFAFFVIEDGPTRAQLIISPDLWESHRALLRDASFLVVDAAVEDTGHQPAIKALTLASLPLPITVRGYHYGG